LATLEDAIVLAALAHKGQRDKAGAKYILHPLRLMLQMQTDEERMVAVLHDVVEDSDHTLDDLRQRGFPEDVIDAIDALSRRKADGETYEEFIARAGRNPLASRVKIADLEDNSDLTRIAAPTEKDFRRVERYRRALEALRALCD
jgi:(p)ppGpp synthase/HD superfamily hydrolase